MRFTGANRRELNELAENHQIRNCGLVAPDHEPLDHPVASRGQIAAGLDLYGGTDEPTRAQRLAASRLRRRKAPLRDVLAALGCRVPLTSDQ